MKTKQTGTIITINAFTPLNENGIVCKTKTNMLKIQPDWMATLKN